MKWIGISVVMLVCFLLDAHFYSVVMSRGGFEAFVASNCMWASALSIAVVWNVVCGVVCWALSLD